MKKRVILFCLSSALLIGQIQALTLSEVRSYVLAGNPSVREALQRVAAAEAVLKQAQSAYLPTVTATGSYGTIDASLHPDTNLQNRYADSWKQADFGLQANWLLFNGFAREARTLAAQYALRQSRELVDETRRLLILSATISFRQAQQARQNVEIAEQDFAFNKNLEGDAQKRFKAGTLPESEVHNFSIRALQAESSALNSKLNYKIACAVLAELMAFPDARLSESMQPVAIVFDVTQTLPTLEDELQLAFAHRPDYQALQSGLLALEQQVRAAKGDKMPQIALTGTVNYSDRDDLSTTNHHGNYDSFVGLTASWDLFSGGRKSNAVKQAQAELRALEERREALRLSIRSALRQRLDQAETAREVFQRQKKIHELTVSVRDSVEKSYRAGMVPITRLNEAQTDLVQARGAYSTSYIAYRLILNRLDIETGKILADSSVN
jgi:outer membrane protein TolC